MSLQEVGVIADTDTDIKTYMNGLAEIRPATPFRKEGRAKKMTTYV